MNNVIENKGYMPSEDDNNDDGDLNFDPIEIETMIDTRNEVEQLRKLLDKVVVSGIYEDNSGEMLRYVEMAVTLSNTIKYLQNPEVIDLNLGFDFEDEEDEENDVDE